MQPMSFIRPEEVWQQIGVRAQQTVVHLGCGAGFYLIPAAKIVGSQGTVTGVDLLPDMLAEATSRAQQAGVEKIVRTIRSNLENPNGSTLPPAHADWVLIANVLHQSDPIKILTEAIRILKPAGHIVIIEWQVGATPLGPSAHHRLPAPEVKTMLTSLGLKVVKEFQPSPYHYGLVVAR